MTPPTNASGVLDKTIQIAATATTAVIMLIAGEEMLPSRYYPLNPPFSSGYEWDISRDYSGKAEDSARAISEFQVIREFVTQLVTNSKDLEPRFDQLISENFWELV